MRRCENTDQLQCQSTQFIASLHHHLPYLRSTKFVHRFAELNCTLLGHSIAVGRGSGVVAASRSGEGDMLKVAGIWLILTSIVSLSGSVMAAQQTASRSSEHLYSEKCAKCHGSDGSAHTAAATNMNAADLRSDRVQRMSDEDLYVATAEGKGHKNYPHAFLHRGLTEQQIRGLVQYIRTFGNSRK